MYLSGFVKTLVLNADIKYEIQIQHWNKIWNMDRNYIHLEYCPGWMDIVYKTVENFLF